MMWVLRKFQYSVLLLVSIALIVGFLLRNRVVELFLGSQASGSNASGSNASGSNASGSNASAIVFSNDDDGQPKQNNLDLAESLNFFSNLGLSKDSGTADLTKDPLVSSLGMSLNSMSTDSSGAHAASKDSSGASSLSTILGLGEVYSIQNKKKPQVQSPITTTIPPAGLSDSVREKIQRDTVQAVHDELEGIFNENEYQYKLE